MKNTEQEYWVLDELISMPDRELAERTMSLLWSAYGTLDDQMMARLVELIQAETCEHWRFELRKYVDAEMQKRGVVPNVIENYEHPCGVVDPKLHGIRPRKSAV